MKKSIFLVTGVLLSLSLHAGADDLHLLGVGFNAPNINGTANAGNPNIGDIIFDISSNSFKGYGGASPGPGWVALSAYSTAKQVAIGTSQTSDGTVTSTSFAYGTNFPTVTFTATSSGLYRIYGSIPASVSNGGDAGQIQIANSAGTATINFSQSVILNDSASLAPHNYYVYTIATLVSGTSYTFRVQGLNNTSGHSLYLNNSYISGGTAIIAEQVQ